MATGRPDLFLQAEEEANRLVEVLTQLKNEVESYRTAREALDQAAAGVSQLSTRCAEIAQQLSDLAGTLRAIGTPELLRGLEAITGELRLLRQDVEQQREAQRQELQSVHESLGAQAEAIAGELRLLQQDLEQQHEAQRQELQSIHESLGTQAEAIASELRLLRQDLEQQREAQRQELQSVHESLGAQVTRANSAVTAVRNLTRASIGLSLIALAVLGWLVLTLARG